MPTYVRVKDEGTGHEFDVLDSNPLIGGPLRLLNKPQYPPTWAPRRTKHNVGPLPVPTKPDPPKTAEKKEAHRG